MPCSLLLQYLLGLADSENPGQYVSFCRVRAAAPAATVTFTSVLPPLLRLLLSLCSRAPPPPLAPSAHAHLQVGSGLDTEQRKHVDDQLRPLIIDASKYPPPSCYR